MLFLKFQYEMRAVEQPVAEGFFLVGYTQVTAKVKDGIVIAQWQSFQETLQLLETFADFGRIGFMGFGIGLVELVENGFSITIPVIKEMVVCVGF